jgi:hypothetical protein
MNRKAADFFQTSLAMSANGRGSFSAVVSFVSAFMSWRIAAAAFGTSLTI